MSDSIWKKEVSFKRKPKDEAPSRRCAAPSPSPTRRSSRC